MRTSTSCGRRREGSLRRAWNGVGLYFEAYYKLWRDASFGGLTDSNARVKLSQRSKLFPVKGVRGPRGNFTPTKQPPSARLSHHGGFIATGVIRYYGLAKFAVALAGALVAVFPCGAEAANPNPAPKSRWVSSKRILKCIGNDGKTLLTFKKGIPTYSSKLPEIPPNYRAINFIVLNKGASAAIFDFNNGGTTVTFYVGGCIPGRTYSYPDLELYTFAHNLKSGLGLVVAMANIDKTFSEDFDRTGYFVQWDSSGTEKIKVGPFPFSGDVEELAMFQGERYGEFRYSGRGPEFQHIYLDFSKGVYYEYAKPGGMSGWKREITSDGKLRVYQLTGQKTPDGRVLPPGELQRLPLPEFQRLAPLVVPQYRLVHEHQF